jgi:F-type H+-transporting ATPase subunit epsilon
VKLEILTPNKSLFEGKIKSINVPGSKGSFTVLHNHAPIISTLEKGEIRILTEADIKESITILGGIIEVNKNTIVVLADI